MGRRKEGREGKGGKEREGRGWEVGERRASPALPLHPPTTF